MKGTSLTDNNTRVNIILLIIMFLLIISSSLFPVPDGMGEKGLTTVLIIILGIILWSTSLLPSAITAMLIIILFSIFNIVPFAQSASNLGKEIIWLLVSMLILSRAVEKTALHKRMVYNMFVFARGSFRLILLFIIFFLFLMTFFIPNIIGRIMLIIPICVGLIDSMEKQNIKNLGKIIIPTITFVPVISAFSVITGSGGTLYAVDLFDNLLGYKWGYLEWLIVMMPVGIITVIIYWVILVYVIFPDVVNVNAEFAYIHEEKKKIGLVSVQEIIIIFLYIILFTLWLTKEIHGFSLAMSSVMMASVLFFPKINILTWKEAVESVEWGIPFVFAAGFSIAQALYNSGVTNWFSLLASNYLSKLSTFSMVLILVLLLAIIRLGFVNNTMMIAAVMPIIVSFASGTIVNPLWLGMIGLIASFICFVLPMQTISNMFTFSLGYHTLKDHLLLGAIITVILIIVTLSCAFYYWPLIGLNIFN